MVKSAKVSNYHVLYQDITSQHWHPSSEQFAGADNLMTALDYGWEIEKCELLRHWFAGLRSVKIYNFHLQRNGSTMTMPVVNNPYIYRFIEQEEIDVVVAESAEIA